VPHSSTDAARLLKTAKWNLNVAVELFFDDDAAQESAAARSGAEGRGVREAREKKLRAIFDDFKGACFCPAVVRARDIAFAWTVRLTRT
jgi:hypothetical protein